MRKARRPESEIVTRVTTSVFNHQVLMELLYIVNIEIERNKHNSKSGGAGLGLS